VFCSKSTLKEGKEGKKIGCKIAKKRRRGGAKSHNWQKDRGKSVIKHKKVHLIRKGQKDGVQNRSIKKRGSAKLYN